LIGLYLQESFGGRQLDATERQSVARAFGEVMAALRQAIRRKPG
jgi:hypothetical protein